MHYDYFISARYRNKDNALALARRIRERGKTVYCFVESRASVSHVGDVDSDGEKAMAKFEAIPDWRNDTRVRDLFETDMEAERNSDALILLLPAGKSAHIEAGVAYGMGKKLILVGEQKETESLYLIFDECYNSVDEFIQSLG
jgi:hypothetical protein